MATNLPTKAPEWRGDIEAMAQEFTRSLPAQIPTERFVRTILTAMQIAPELARADRRTLKMSCMRAAQDGLLPDGREGALVIYKTKVKRKNEQGLEVESWVDAVQWMPMVWGLLKKARNSGEIASITGHVVYKHDKFRLVFGDEELLEHEPNRDVDDAECIEANAVGAYAIAKLKDGTIVRAWRSRAQIMRAKSQSKAANGPMWTKFWEEGWVKTAIRYLMKYLPSSTDKEGVDTFARAAERDDEMYDFNRARDVTPGAEPAASKLDRFVQTQHAAQDAQEPRGEPIDDQGSDAPGDPSDPADAPQDGEGEGDLWSGDDPRQMPIHLFMPGEKRPRRTTIMAASVKLQGLLDGCNAKWLQSAWEANPWIANDPITRDAFEAANARLAG